MCIEIYINFLNEYLSIKKYLSISLFRILVLKELGLLVQ